MPGPATAVAAHANADSIATAIMVVFAGWLSPFSGRSYSTSAKFERTSVRRSDDGRARPTQRTSVAVLTGVRAPAVDGRSLSRDARSPRVEKPVVPTRARAASTAVINYCRRRRRSGLPVGWGRRGKKITAHSMCGNCYI